MDDAKQLSCPPDRDFIDCDPLWAVLFQMHIDLKIYPSLFDRCLYMGFIISELYDIPVLCPTVGLCRPGEIKGFQDICLSLGIVPVQDVRVRICSDQISNLKDHNFCNF